MNVMNLLLYKVYWRAVETVGMNLRTNSSRRCTECPINLGSCTIASSRANYYHMQWDNSTNSSHRSLGPAKPLRIFVCKWWLYWVYKLQCSLWFRASGTSCVYVPACCIEHQMRYQSRLKNSEVSHKCLPGMWRRVVLYIVTDVAEELSAVHS
jgi:hypothetical protein